MSDPTETEALKERLSWIRFLASDEELTVLRTADRLRLITLLAK